MKHLCLAFVFTAAFASAHHAFTAEFDATKPVKLQGTVWTCMEDQPHAWIHIDVNPDGTVTSWMVEGGSPNTLLRNGVTKASVTAGMEIVVDKASKTAPTELTAATSRCRMARSCLSDARHAANDTPK